MTKDSPRGPQKTEFLLHTKTDVMTTEGSLLVPGCGVGCLSRILRNVLTKTIVYSVLLVISSGLDFPAQKGHVEEMCELPTR